MNLLGTAEDSHDKSYEISQQNPVAHLGNLKVVHLHTHTHKHIDEHCTGVEYHESEEEKNTALDAARLQCRDEEIGRTTGPFEEDEQKH